MNDAPAAPPHSFLTFSPTGQKKNEAVQREQRVFTRREGSQPRDGCRTPLPTRSRVRTETKHRETDLHAEGGKIPRVRR